MIAAQLMGLSFKRATYEYRTFVISAGSLAAQASIIGKDDMDVNVVKILTWIIVGGLSGSFLGMLMTRKKQGFGRFSNLMLGMVGALVGGGLFNILNVDLSLGNFSISFEDLIAAFTGSVLVLMIVWFIKRKRGKKREKS